ncbi:MAG: endosialidase [Lachnospiraceae bacterium]
MAVVEQLLRAETDGSISFGNHKLVEKAKLEDFEQMGDLYKVKTYAKMTKLEKNGMFVYESVPGTSVIHLQETEDGMTFTVEGDEDAQITVGLEEDMIYEVFVDGASVGRMSTNLSGKLNISAELAEASEVEICIKR